MKKFRMFPVLLALALIVGIIAVPGFSLVANAAIDIPDVGVPEENSLIIDKDAMKNEDGSYTITLEAYATGEKVITSVDKDIPTDIVLVIDQSGSMERCIVCGEKKTDCKCFHFSEVTSVDIQKTYYIKNGNSYTEVTYCNGTHTSRYDTINCKGGAGWYTGTKSEDHRTDNKITPKTSANPNGTQFYEKVSEFTSRLDSLKTAVTTFVNSVTDKAKGADGLYGTEDDVNHRIAIVGFGTGSTDSANSSSPKYENTELFIGSNQYNYSDKLQSTDKATLASEKYSSAFQDMNTQTGYNNVIASKDTIEAAGATQVDLGIEMANGIFNVYPIGENENRNRVMVVFTDGVPSAWTGYSSSVAESAISNAEITKNTYKATVYAVGIFDGADATSPGDSNGTTDAQKANWLLQNVSSNNGKVQSPSYYLSAGDEDTLNNIFKQIADKVESGGTSTTLSSETVIRDIISPQFTLPDGATAENITLETWKCTGVDINDEYTWTKNDDAMGATVQIKSTGSDATTTNNQVSVTGFDFAKNYVGTETTNGVVTGYRGHKLVIKFTVTVRDGFLGGNNVYTNTSAGVYENEDAKEPVKTFPQPDVDVSIGDVTITDVQTNVYLGGYYSDTITGEEIKEALEKGMTCKINGIDIDFSKENYGLASWQNAYVDITITIKDSEGNDISTGIDMLTDDVTYTVTVTVSPKTEGSATENTGTGSDTIHVFKPELTYKDSEVWYGGDDPESYTGNLTQTRWIHSDKNLNEVLDADDENVKMLGAEPKLDVTYAPETGKIVEDKIASKQDIPVDVTVKIKADGKDDWDVTQYVTFKHTKCENDSTCTDPTNGKFWLHVNTCQLEIKKTGGADNESYVFDVYKDGTKYTEVTIWGNSSEIIYELPVGTYTIKENIGWSWRYSATYSADVKLSSTNTFGTITCNNTSNTDKWLNGFSTIVKNIFGDKEN